MSQDKERLIRIAGDLQRTVNELLECAKGDDEKEESDNDTPKASYNKAGMIALSLKRKLDK